MKTRVWLKQAVLQLQNSDISTAQLDAELLLADRLKKDRSWLHAHPDFELQRSDLRILNEQITRRSNHEPIAYIRGKQEFFGREFIVSPATLTPRPETETMVEMALNLLKKHAIKSVADVGSGSGCISISLQLESQTSASITGYEISREALEIALKNAKKLGSTVAFRKSDITATKEGWSESELILANLPYVPTDFKINNAATHEPDFAIFGGKDGLDYYRKLFENLSNQVQFVLAESLPPQHSGLQKIAESNGFKPVETNDLIQLFAKK